MYGQEVLWLYLGAVGAIFLLNVVQWSFSRDWINGLFTLQTFTWFAYSLFQRVFLDEDKITTEGLMVVHAMVHSIVQIVYLELVQRLFLSEQSRWRTWLRWGQAGLLLYPLVETVLLLVTNEAWQATTSARLIATGYWSLLVGNCVLGCWVSASRRDAMGRSFLVGSVLMLLFESNSLFFYTVSPWNWLKQNTPDYLNLVVQIFGGGRLIQLLCFSFCQLFRQRQLDVKQAVNQARLAEQLIQERLETELAVRRLEQEKTDVQLRALQAQVNPHFLFNSLNSLSSLIDDDPQRAGTFVDRLSQVYRYLLRANDQPLTTLANELDFIESYYHLLQTRHGKGLTLTYQVDVDYRQRLIPPLTLQLLVENAVKHNVILTSRPLHILIFTDEAGQLIVQNNLQRKNTPVLSNGVGLSGILAKYRTLDQPEPVILTDNDAFVVRLPLIEPITELT
jgi:hypothetical protein